MSANAFGQTLAMRLSPTVHHPIRIALGISLTAACAIGAWAEEAKPYQPRGATGVGVRTLAELALGAESWNKS